MKSFFYPTFLSIACNVMLAACGGGGGGGASSLPRVDSANGPIVASPAFVQYFTYSTASGGAEESHEVNLGTSGSGGKAPASGDYLVALVDYADNGQGPDGITTSSVGWSAPANSTVYDTWEGQAVFEYQVPSGGAPSTVTFTSDEYVTVSITIVEVSGTSGIDIVTTNSGSGTMPFGITTGTATQTGGDDLGLILSSSSDYLSQTSDVAGPAGYTQLDYQCMIANSLGPQFGDTEAVFASNNLIAAASVPAEAVTWRGDSGTWSYEAQQVLMKPIFGSPTPAPSPL